MWFGCAVDIAMDLLECVADWRGNVMLALLAGYSSWVMNPGAWEGEGMGKRNAEMRCPTIHQVP